MPLGKWINQHLLKREAHRQESHNQALRNFCQKPMGNIDSLLPNGKLILTEIEPEAFEKDGKRIDAILLLKCPYYRDKHWVPTYRIVLVELKTSNTPWQREKGTTQLEAGLNFFSENWEDWTDSHLNLMTLNRPNGQEEIWLHPLLVYAHLSRRNDANYQLLNCRLPRTIKLGRLTYSYTIAAYLHSKGGLNELMNLKNELIGQER